MKRTISILMLFIMLLLLCSCSKGKQPSALIKIGVIDSCISESMVQELNIKKYYKISDDITSNNITHGSIITIIIQQQSRNCDIFFLLHPFYSFLIQFFSKFFALYIFIFFFYIFSIYFI